MILTVKLMGFFFISFILLSVPVNNETLFSYVSKKAAPQVEMILNTFHDIGEDVFRKCKILGKQLFSNSIPRNLDRLYSSENSKKGPSVIWSAQSLPKDLMQQDTFDSEKEFENIDDTTSSVGTTALNN